MALIILLKKIPSLAERQASLTVLLDLFGACNAMAHRMPLTHSQPLTVSDGLILCTFEVFFQLRKLRRLWAVAVVLLF